MQDVLRFTLHFFPLIQRSAPHIYHSALPLSPRLSPLRLTIPHEKTLISDFYGCPDAWGTVIRTIKPYSDYFAHVTTFGHWIAASSSDYTVAIYDSVTGALRLHLSPGGIVYAISGSPDGSTLFCVHNKASITGWDIQTGGIIHTFIERKAGKIAVCSNSRYLACGSIDGSVKIWEVANKSEVATFGSGTPVTHLCWLEPGKQLLVAGRESAKVWDVVARRVLWNFTTNYEICGVAYAQRLDRFAIATSSKVQSTITVVDPHTGTSFIHNIPRHMSSLAFSPVTNEFVCSLWPHGLGLFSVPARGWRQLDHPFEITSVSTLLNGTVVAESVASGIQLLSLDEGYPLPQQSIFPGGRVYTIDEGNIVVLDPEFEARGPVVLLETATMSKLPNIPTWTLNNRNPSKILCASLKHRIAVQYGPYLQLWRFGDETASWIDDREHASTLWTGGISPNGSRLAVISYSGASAGVRAWDIENGTRVADIRVGLPWFTHPLKIKFESEDKFYSHHDTFRIPFTISSSSIIRHEHLPPAEQPQKRYDVDGSRQWIIGSSKRVCWIPPEYMRPVDRSYCWAGNALITAGRDGAVRKITFREPS